MDGARTALAHTAAILGTREADDIPQHPQKRHVLRGLDAPILTVNSQSPTHIRIMAALTFTGLYVTALDCAIRAENPTNQAISSPLVTSQLGLILRLNGLDLLIRPEEGMF